MLLFLLFLSAFVQLMCMHCVFLKISWSFQVFILRMQCICLCVKLQNPFIRINCTLCIYIRSVIGAFQVDCLSHTFCNRNLYFVFSMFRSRCVFFFERIEIQFMVLIQCNNENKHYFYRNRFFEKKIILSISFHFRTIMSMCFKWEMVVLFDSFNKGSIFIVLVRIFICAFFLSDSFFVRK